MYFAEALEITKGKVIGIDPYTMGSLVNKIPDENLNTYFYDVLFKDQIILDNLYSGLIKIINEKSAASLLGITFRSIRYRLSKFGLGDDDTEE